MTPVTAPPEQHKGIKAISRSVANVTTKRQASQCRLVDPNGESTIIPEAVFSVLKRVVEVLARGDALAIVPVGKELTTQQAADLLNVSRQYLVRLLDEGRLPHHKTGRHRRLRFADVMAFKEKRDRERRAGLDELTRLSEEFGGYEELK